MRNTLALMSLTAAFVAAPISNAAHAPQKHDSARPTLTNPILPSGPDPFILTHDGWFYFTATRGDRLAIRRTRDLGKLAEAEEVVVWRPAATGDHAISIWAPELHRFDGKWFMYFTAAAAGHDDDAHRGVFVLENDAADPLTGRWVDRGRVDTALPGIDGTVFEARGRRWFAYSAYDGPDSVLMIAPLANPWTLATPAVTIARPDQPWERQGGRQILEGPEFLAGPKGDLFLAYSASACWSDDYALGLLRLRPGADSMIPANWTKAPRPVLAKVPGNDVYAPGHNAFFTANGGRETWIAYHANQGAGVGCGAKRSPRVQRMRWASDGTPIFPVPARAGQRVEAPLP
ncbi:Beta-xylosidase, GH43 family [Sphingomonas gellani]|uniref:Beta-xylosidase, GH43 family n=1 Tax=Sphingomonas gellani TaxID=1166340 RepID=A0A1H8CXX5_9SPHN|nr:glycoside hydrolase family 43 protein [Sphingomonas gellani]SEM99732.1 Beta-xylosidase, GH43 family [Sphingomonas gellani]